MDGMTTTPRIVIARRAVDWDAAMALLSDYLDWLHDHVPGDLPADALAAAMSDLERLPERFSAPGCMLVAWVGRVPVGTLGVRRHHGENDSGEDSDIAELARFFVRPIARGTGVGAALLGAALDHLAAAGVRRVVLDTLPNEMAAAARLYERFGFTIDGPSATGGGTCVGAMRMSRSLTDGTRALVGAATAGR